MMRLSVEISTILLKASLMHLSVLSGSATRERSSSLVKRAVLSLLSRSVSQQLK